MFCNPSPNPNQDEHHFLHQNPLDVYLGASEPEPIPVEEDHLDENQKLFLIMEDQCENHDDTLAWRGGSEEIEKYVYEKLIEEVQGNDKC